MPDTKSPKEVGLSPNIFPLGVRHSTYSKKADCSLDSESRRSLRSQEGVKLLEGLGPHIYCIICPVTSFGKLPLGWPNMSKALSSSKNRSNQALYVCLRCCVVGMEGGMEASRTVPGTGLAPKWWLLLWSNHQHHSSVSPWSHLLKKKGNKYFANFWVESSLCCCESGVYFLSILQLRK